MKISSLPRFFALLFALNTLVAPLRADEITVSAAASLRDVLTVLGKDFSRGQTAIKDKVRFNFGSSGALQKQIEAGAPIDLFIAAAPKNIAQLGETGDIEPATRRIFARGELVLIAPRNSTLRSFGDLRAPQIRAISVGGPGVPAGDYARQTLKFLRLSAALQSKLVFARDVRAVLNSVALGNADAGFAYRTDALSSKAVRIVAVAPPQSHDSVIYPMAIVKNSSHRAGALRFWRFLQSTPARITLKRFDFGR